MKPDKKILNKVFIAILAISVLQTSANAINSALFSIATAFPGYSMTAIQTMSTVASLSVILSTIVSTWLSRSVSTKFVALLGCAITGIFGVLPAFFTNSFPLIFVCSILKGFGIGLVFTLSSGALVSKNWVGHEKDVKMGFQSVSHSFGGMVMAYLGGIFAAVSWNMTFHVYWIAFPIFFIVLFTMPKDKDLYAEEVATKPKLEVNKKLVYYAIISFLYLGFFHVQSLNIAENIMVKKLGDAAQAGGIITVFMLATLVGGLSFSTLAKTFGKYTLVFSFIVCGISNLVHGLASSLTMVYVAAAIGGIGLSFATCTLVPWAAYCVKSASRVLVGGLISTCINLGLFFCPIMMNPIAAAILGDGPVARYYLSFGALIALGVVDAIKRVVSKEPVPGSEEWIKEEAAEKITAV